MSDIGTQQFEFRGRAGEWFGIWIVNLLLSIVTLGIYSAWAKVRRKKYFYNHTFVADRNFDYHATGKQILIGRAIVVVGFIVYSFLAAIPIVNIVVILGLLVIFPWLIVRSLMFNARMSSWSNVRFNFTGNLKQAFLVYLLYPFLTVLTLYLAFPFLDRAMRRFTISNHKLGTAEFEFKSSIGPFYKAFFAAIAWVTIVGAILIMLTGFSFVQFAGAMETAEQNPEVFAVAIITFYAIFFVAFLPAVFIYQAMVRNTVFNSTTLEGGHQFRSTVSPATLLWLAVSNAVVVGITLGLMLPWAQVRMQKYLASQTFLLPGESLDNFVGRQVDEGMSIGDAYTDFEGIDIGLGV